jgi:hypothetical protein
MPPDLIQPSDVSPSPQPPTNKSRNDSMSSTPRAYSPNPARSESVTSETSGLKIGGVGICFASGSKAQHLVDYLVEVSILPMGQELNAYTSEYVTTHTHAYRGGPQNIVGKSCREMC